MEIGKFKLAKADLVRPPRVVKEQIIPKPKPYTKKVFKLEVDDFIKGFIGGFPKDEMLLKIQSILDKAVDKGAIEPQEGIEYLKKRKQQLVDFARDNYGKELPGIEDEDSSNVISDEVNKITNQVASAETDELKEKFDEKLGPGVIKTLDELPPVQDPFKDFEDRNPRETAAEGGRIGFDKGGDFAIALENLIKNKDTNFNTIQQVFDKTDTPRTGNTEKVFNKYRDQFKFEKSSALSFGEKQNIHTPQTFQKILGAAGQEEYPEAYKVITDALKKAGIEYTPSPGGTGAIFNNVTEETIDIFNKEATKLRAEQGLPMSRYQTKQLKKDIKIFVKDKIAKEEYVSRPVIKEHFGLGRGGDMLITRSLGVNEKAGTGLLKNLGQDERIATAIENAAKATAATMETKNEVLKTINDEFRLDPDLSNSEDLAKTIYGDQFPKGNMNDLPIEDLRKAESLVRQTDNDVMTYLKVIKGLRDKPDKMRLPTQNVINDITDNILSGIDDEAGEGQSFKKKGFRFSSGLLRDYKMAIINQNLGLDTNVYKSERDKLVLKNKNLDEIFSMSALADIAPGYTTKVQSIKKLINARKASEIDKPFQTIVNALNDGKTSMQWNGEIVPIEDAIKDFNKTSSKFSKREKVQSPKINYNVKFDESILDSYGKASQENIKQVYKDKKFFLSDIDPKIKTEDILKKLDLTKTNVPTGEVKKDITNVQKVFRKMQGQLNSGVDPKLLVEYLGAEVKDLAAFGQKYGGDALSKVGKGVAGIDLPIFQTLFASTYDLEQDSPVWLTLPLAFTDEVSNMFNLYNKSEGKFGLGKVKDFGKFVASSFVPRVMRSPLFKAASKVGRAGSFAAPVLELGKQAYLSEKRKGMLPDIARQFDIPIEKAREGYDNFVKQSQIRGMQSMVDDTEIPEMSQQGQNNLNSLINSFKQLGSVVGVSEDPYAEKESIYTRGIQNPMSLDRALYPNRQNFADGPEDPSKKGLGSLSKRQFLKILSLIPAGILAIRGGPNVLKKSKKAAELVKRGADGMPDFIFDLVAKVKAKAAEKGTKYFTGNRSDEFADVYQADNFVVKEQGDKITIREVDDPDRPGYRENEIELEYDRETGGYTYNEASARPDGDGKLKDVDEYIEEDDLENMRKYTYDE